MEATQTKEPTKTVEGIFGKPKQITRADFIERWSSHFGQMYRLADTTAEYEELKSMAERVRAIAGASWDRLPTTKVCPVGEDSACQTKNAACGK